MAVSRAGLRLWVALRPRLIGGPLQWAHAESFQEGEGANNQTPKKSTIFGRAEGADENFCVFRDILTDFMRLYCERRMFRKRAAYAVIFKFQGWVVASR